MLPVPFLATNEVIITSLLSLKIIYVLINFPDFIRDLYIFFKRNMDSANKFNIMIDVIMTKDYVFLQSSCAQKLEMTSTLIIVCNFGGLREILETDFHTFHYGMSWQDLLKDHIIFSLGTIL